MLSLTSIEPAPYTPRTKARPNAPSGTCRSHCHPGTRRASQSRQRRTGATVSTMYRNCTHSLPTLSPITEVNGGTSWYMVVSRPQGSHQVECLVRACGQGAPGWNRTSGLRFRKPTLYPLSYGSGIATELYRHGAPSRRCNRQHSSGAERQHPMASATAAQTWSIRSGDR